MDENWGVVIDCWSKRLTNKFQWFKPQTEVALHCELFAAYSYTNYLKRNSSITGICKLINLSVASEDVLDTSTAHI